MTLFDPVSLLDDDPAILRYPTALLESLRDGWSSSLELLEGAAMELVPAHPIELGGQLSRIDDLGQGLVDGRLFDGTHPLYDGRPQSAAGRLRFLGDVVLGLLARGHARRVGSELTALRETIDTLGEIIGAAPAAVGRLRGPRAVEYLALSWPFQVRSASYYDGCVPPYDNLPTAPPPLPPPPLPLWTTPPPPDVAPVHGFAVPPPLPLWTTPPPPAVHVPKGFAVPPPLPPWTTPPPAMAVEAGSPATSERGAWTLPHLAEPPPLPPLPSFSYDDEGSSEAPVPDEGRALVEQGEGAAEAEEGFMPTPRSFPHAPEVQAPVDADAAEERASASAHDPEGDEPGDEPGHGETDDDAAAPKEAPPMPVPSIGIGSLVTDARSLEPIDDEPLPELASRVTVPLFERELVRLFGELSLLAYEAGRLFGARDRTPRLLARELRRLEHPTLTDALLGDGARGMHVDRALMRMVAEAQGLLDEWRDHAEGEGELLDVEVRALRKALDARAVVLCQATLAAGVAVGLSDEDWSDHWAGLAEDADDERLAHEGGDPSHG